MTTPLTTAKATGSRWRKRGHSRPKNAATAAPSSPQRRGSPRASPSNAPSKVNRFHSTNTPNPAVQNPRCCSAGAVWPAAVAVDSSMVMCAATGLRQPWGLSRWFICMPYTALRTPSSAAAPTAADTAPPPAITPIKANCEPPVNIRRLSAMAWPTLRPAATASAPKEMP